MLSIFPFCFSTRLVVDIEMVVSGWSGIVCMYPHCPSCSCLPSLLEGIISAHGRQSIQGCSEPTSPHSPLPPRSPVNTSGFRSLRPRPTALVIEDWSGEGKEGFPGFRLALLQSFLTVSVFYCFYLWLSWFTVYSFSDCAHYKSLAET